MNIPRFYPAALILSLAVHIFLLVLPQMTSLRDLTRPKADFVMVHLSSRPAQSTTAQKKAQLANTTASAKQIADAKEPAVTTANELLSDPRNAAVFLRYFQSIKSRIQLISEKHRQYATDQSGKIELDFVLNRSGQLLTLNAYPHEGSTRSTSLVSRALRILREAVPFSEFPNQIKAKSISFNVTLVFDDNRA